MWCIVLIVPSSSLISGPLQGMRVHSCLLIWTTMSNASSFTHSPQPVLTFVWVMNYRPYLNCFKVWRERKNNQYLSYYYMYFYTVFSKEVLFLGTNFCGFGSIGSLRINLFKCWYWSRFDQKKLLLFHLLIFGFVDKLNNKIDKYQCSTNTDETRECIPYEHWVF